MLIGIVGRPNVGKSTFFKAATLADVLIANYPFATIKPNHAVGYVKVLDLAPEFGKVSEPREGFVRDGMNEKGERVKGMWRFVPVELIDVAGLGEGASEGRGLGNEFLNDLASADALIQVIDASGESDAEGKPTQNYSPGEDIRVIERELDKWYLKILSKVWRSFAKSVQVSGKNFEEAIAEQFSGLRITREHVKSAVKSLGLDVKHSPSWSEDELLRFARELRKKSKPMLIVANKMDRPNSRKNLEKIKEEFEHDVVPCFADGELALKEADRAGLIEYVPGESSFEIKAELSEKQREALDKIKKFMEEFGSTGVQEALNKVVFELLHYIVVFPAGEKLVDSKGRVLPDCFLLPHGSTALDFAYKLHTDIGNNFVKAIDIRTKRAVGKEYVLQHRDGLEILTRS
ncbi:redox-regulated ATPase YchF [Candidatus Pacearchaeota archaeon]|nr:MAG: redox-regulated ATPase YchF [Candidatus Pacearchaeota archaeon]